MVNFGGSKSHSTVNWPNTIVLSLVVNDIIIQTLIAFLLGKCCSLELKEFQSARSWIIVEVRYMIHIQSQYKSGCGVSTMFYITNKYQEHGVGSMLK